MKVIVVGDGEAVGESAARFVVTRMLRNPHLAVALPTGKTPLPMYRSLVEFYRRGVVDFSRARFFNLDEILGLPPTHPASYAAYLNREFLSCVNALPRRTHLLNGGTRCPRLECSRHERTICWVGGLDLAILGVGRNGHIAFNEPGSPLHSRTRVVELTSETVEDNNLSNYLGQLAQHYPRGLRGCGYRDGRAAAHTVGWRVGLVDRPVQGDGRRAYALTMGIGTILQARQVILLASGSRKAGIVAQALQGNLTASVPASALQLHPNVTAILDRGAAGDLDLRKKLPDCAPGRRK